MDERPSLGFSSIGRTTFTTTAADKLRRLALIAAGIVALGGVFYYLTRAVQSSTARATSDDSVLHTDQ